MPYRITAQPEEPSFFTETRSCCKIPYYTVKEMRKRYPDDNFIIIGEIGGMSRITEDADKLYLGEDKFLPILPRGSLKKPFERIIGYIVFYPDKSMRSIPRFAWTFSLRCGTAAGFTGSRGYGECHAPLSRYP